MKRLVVLAIMVIIAFSANAESTGKGQYRVNINPAINEELTEYLNVQNHIVHEHSYEKANRRNPRGVGTDTKVWESKSKETAVEVQSRYDFANREYSVFAVAKLNACGLISKVWSWVTGE